MQNERNQTPLSITEQAAEWFIRWHAGDVTFTERDAYVQWLKTSPVHIAELLRICVHYSRLGSFKPPLDFGDCDEVVVPVLHPHLRDAAYVALNTRESEARRRTAPRLRNLTAMAAMLSVGVGTFSMSWGALHAADSAMHDVFRALPALGTAIFVLISVFALTVGAAIGLRTVQRSGSK